MSFLIETLAGLIALCLGCAVFLYAVYVVLGVIERRQKRNRYVRRIPPRHGFRDDQGPVRVRL